jgi:biotin carboxyl carrier protein
LKFHIEIAGKTRAVEYDPGEGALILDGVHKNVSAEMLRPGVLSLVAEGHAWRIVLDDHPDEPSLQIAGDRIAYRVDDPLSLKARRARAGATDGPQAIKASMPGRVVRVLAQRGDEVDEHQGVVVIEAMKMQNELKAPKSGKIVELRVAPGDTVAVGDVLAVIE